jgi:NADH:ubiquinone oxidoreductase subunit 3 (subunit A)
MINHYLAFGTPGALEILIILVILGLMVAVVVVFLKLLLRNKKENIRLRLEVGKLADELEKARKQKGTEGGDAGNESG